MVNAVGSATIGEGPHFWAAPCEVGAEFGGLGTPAHVPPEALRLRMKGGPPPSTTIALVVTDAVLTKAQAKRLAIMADDGLARAIRPAHAPMDGDTVFAVATLQKPMREAMHDLTDIGLTAADCLARAIARGVYEATALPFPGALPAWKDRFAALVRQGSRVMTRLRLMVACLLALALLLLLGWQAQREQLVKACLDSGGAWTGQRLRPPAHPPDPAARSAPVVRGGLRRENRVANPPHE